MHFIENSKNSVLKLPDEHFEIKIFECLECITPFRYLSKVFLDIATFLRTLGKKLNEREPEMLQKRYMI